MSKLYRENTAQTKAPEKKHAMIYVFVITVISLLIFSLLALLFTSAKP